MSKNKMDHEGWYKVIPYYYHPGNVSVFEENDMKSKKQIPIFLGLLEDSQDFFKIKTAVECFDTIINYKKDLEDFLGFIEELVSENMDEYADIDNESPEDSDQHRNGLIYKAIQDFRKKHQANKGDKK